MLEGRSLARLLVATSLIAAGCGGGGGGSGGSCNDPLTLDVTLDATTFAIGDFTSYTAVVHNPCSSARTGIYLQGYALQGEALRAAGGQFLMCGEGLDNGTVPPGDCTMAGVSFVASNANSGTGVLAAGPAVARIELRQDGASLAIDAADTSITLAE